MSLYIENISPGAADCCTGGCRSSLAMFIFIPCGKATPNMPLSFVDLQDFMYLQIERMIILYKPLGQVLVYCGFADAELLRRSANRGAVFDDVCGQIAGALFNVMLHRYHSPYSRSPSIWGGRGSYESDIEFPLET